MSFSQPGSKPGKMALSDVEPGAWTRPWAFPLFIFF
jgi:hypothetical protein